MFQLSKFSAYAICLLCLIASFHFSKVPAILLKWLPTSSGGGGGGGGGMEGAGGLLLPRGLCHISSTLNGSLEI